MAKKKYILTKPRTKDEVLEILFLDKNQVDNKIAWGLGEGFLSFFSANITPFLAKTCTLSIKP